jgi:tagatose-1,6-bisphosphate aldolase non-catalytic subunit AgaZ/GatZ
MISGMAAHLDPTISGSSGQSVRAVLGIGPLSRNIVDATLEQAYRHRRRVMLIASRRQVEIDDFGSGYVERWTPERFASYVRSHDPERRVLLCRDHGGPWQHPIERDLDADEQRAMDASLTSFRADIDAGFDLLHIDTSADRRGEASLDDAIRRLASLYGECHAAAREAGRDVQFEIGFEAQGVDVAEPGPFGEQVDSIAALLRDRNLPPPTFIVAQTGTRVVETKNDGALTRDADAVSETVARLAKICARAGSALKAHNADYLSSRCLRSLMQHGVAAVNIAPELGVIETRAFLMLLESAGQTKLRDEFLGLAFDSHAWRKWLRRGSTASDREKAIIAGHYVFASTEFSEIKQRLQSSLPTGVRDVDAYLRDALRAQIGRLLSCTAVASLEVPVPAVR